MISADAKGARPVTEAIWKTGSMPARGLADLTLTGDRPLLSTSFHVGVAAQSSIACAALAAASLGELRGVPRQEVGVDMHDAEMECTAWFSIDGVVPRAWAPLSGLYPCADGFVRIHANFDHHRDGVLGLLGIDEDPARVERDALERELAGWKKVAFETAAANAGLVVTAGRSFDEWDAHPQAAAVAALPLFTIERIGDAARRKLPALTDSDQPLGGVRVLDLTRILAGPVCGRSLAAYGAEVMLVNSPRLPNIKAIADTSRGKRSAHIDLTSKQGRERLRQLVKDAHLFVQGYRPGAFARFGFSPEEVAAMCPGIVYVSLSAYGPGGPWSERRGFDSLVQTATGFNVAEAQAAGVDAPRAMPVQILDFASGFLMAFAAQAALHRQLTEGGSWHVRVSLAQTAHWLRQLGRVENNFHGRRPDFAAHAVHYPSGFGDLMAMPHAARFSGASATWRLPSNPPGTDAPAWSDS